MSDDKRTELSAFGEFGLIEELTSAFKPQLEATKKGVGDDAAVMKYGDQLHLLSTDMLVEGIHFDLTYVPLTHLGFKAIAVNVSDIAAMNGVPQQVTVSIAVSNRFSVQALQALYEGIYAACEHYRVDLVGGDTTSSISGLVISVSVTGIVSEDRVVYRSGAQPGDAICVTGDLGAAYMGLQVLEREKAAFMEDSAMQPKLEGMDYIVGRQLKPSARMDLIYELKELNVVPTAMIDVSDGLASELMHIAKQSDVGMKVFYENFPIDNKTYEMALEFKLDPATCALNGGEDYELLFTLPQDQLPKIKHLMDVQPIGEVLEKDEGLSFITKAGQIMPIQAQGWQHF